MTEELNPLDSQEVVEKPKKKVAPKKPLKSIQYKFEHGLLKSTQEVEKFYKGKTTKGEKVYS